MSTTFERISAKAAELGWRCRAVPWTRVGDRLCSARPETHRVGPLLGNGSR